MTGFRERGEFLESQYLTGVARQEALYRESRVTPESALNYLTHVNKEIGASRYGGVEHEHAFYLNSSDSLEILAKSVDVKGQRVMTVAGSGEFAQIFIKNGAKRVDVVDYSMPALFFTELKLIAARELSYEDYLNLFGTIDERREERTRRHNMLKTEIAPVFDTSIYRKIRDQLTEQARMFFDMFSSPKYREYFMVDFYGPTWSGMTRLREPFNRAKWSEIVPFLRSKRNYQELQKSLKSAGWTLRLGDLGDKSLDFSQYDFVYASNASYGLQHQLAENILRAGARRVGFTSNGHDVLFGDWDERDAFREQKFELEKKARDHKKHVKIFNHRGTIRDEQNGREIRLNGVLVGMDGNVNYGMYFEVDAKDNKLVRT